VSVAQAALTLLGFPPDDINGEFDRSTQKQLREFQKFNELKRTGEVDNVFPCIHIV
jgi:peptidoglycan hydrolase-like protein with peptidoglycan-binding domain